jgi:hypothetical protein
MSAAPDCRHARLHIGAAPHELPPEVGAHLETCADCRRFRDETVALDGRLRSALELPLAKFRVDTRERAPRVRRFALAASILFAFVVAGGFWLLQPRSALAGEVAEHVQHEAGSWDMREPLPPAQVADVLREAGVRFDTSLPVVYAMACPFRGRQVPHFVVQTPDGPMTVMLLAHERVATRTEFSEGGYRGVLLPAGAGSVALLTRAGDAVPARLAEQIAAAVHF